jgi:hypothetical protein
MRESNMIEPQRELETIAETPGTSDIVRMANRHDHDGVNPAEPLFTEAESGKFRTRWDQVQTDFVDDPRSSVEKADQLVADAIKRLAELFAEQRTRLEREWDKGDSVSTEDLRQALRRYRSFFDRLLSAGADVRPMR